TGVDPYDDQPMIPYDLDEDGVVDSWDENGLVEFVTVWPSHFFVGDYQDGSFHEHCFKITKNEEMGWVVAFFMDGRYLMESYYETPGYEDWAEIAQIAVCMSTDHGATWSEPAYLNAKVDDVNFYPELEGMLPCYIYPADEIEIVENNHGRIPIIFFNDNSYGSYSSPVVHGQNNGGTITYAVLDIEIVTDTDDNTVAPVYNLAQNYPNPFNPITTIAYSLKEAANVTLEVFNIKGQKVKTLINEFKQPSDYSVIWDGRDDQGRLQDSGIYFYKLNVGKYSSAKKMLLLK
ncbi:MAG: T9SS type A sorting domain-containing protein, partial [Candidatus Cloacimonetes bacterium]|nr:T9SS type A sorting domain-containing protein [Candidatus Cloacimonadota bacterium]